MKIPFCFSQALSQRCCFSPGRTRWDPRPQEHIWATWNPKYVSTRAWNSRALWSKGSWLMPRKGPKYSHKNLLFCRALEELRLIDWSTKIKLIFFLSFLWPSHLDRGVNCERKDAKEEAVEHAEDWGATVVRVLLGTWEKVLLDWLLILRLGLGLGSGCPQGSPGDLRESQIGHLATCNESRANCIEIGQINSTLPFFQSFKHYGNLNLRWRQMTAKVGLL